jgi:alpha-galactosidase
MAEHLKKFGWQYIVVDSGWYVTKHSAGTNAKGAEFSLDAYGRYTPATNAFPSVANGAGFKPLADFVHSLGLKFGVHILRGIPKEAVRGNLPIAGASFHAADAANTADTCPWNPFNYGLDAVNPAAQALWSIFRSPLIMGGNLTLCDEMNGPNRCSPTPKSSRWTSVPPAIMPC